MTADQEGFQRTGIGISDCWMLSQGAELAQGRRADPQQAAHFARSVYRGRVDPGLVEELPELSFGQAQNLGVTLAPRNASKTAGERLYATHGITPLPMPARRCERAQNRPRACPSTASAPSASFDFAQDWSLSTSALSTGPDPGRPDPRRHPDLPPHPQETAAPAAQLRYLSHITSHFAFMESASNSIRGKARCAKCTGRSLGSSS